MMGSEPFLPYGRQLIDDDDVEAVVQVLHGDLITTGPVVTHFEHALGQRIGASSVVACSSGTAALHLALLALNLQPGKRDAAIVPSVTFAATANVARFIGLHVVFSDVDPETGLMRDCDLEAALCRARSDGLVPRVVLPVHFAGQSADVPVLVDIASSASCAVVVDAAHALGSQEPGGIPVGSDQSTAHMTCFSFHPVKTITTGEGGAVTTSDPDLGQTLQRLRSHGITREPSAFMNRDMGFTEERANPWYYELQDIGPNYRITDIQCALGLSQLGKLDRFLESRAAQVARYHERLAPMAPLIRPLKNLHRPQTGWHLFVALIDFDAAGTSRAHVMDALHKAGIGTQVHYIPVHTQPYYRQHSPWAELPGAMEYYRRTLSLPLFPGMTVDQVDRVVDTLQSLPELQA
ncbi:UDP-4-amino-4,6-dideoxy-N-acetyl-beta-L-altrosamine transaminase [Haematospirillum jordaniae]|nr:UDP-4-amino-4,6-dideoxy-N-acetyl-beta-L-altrosamine transaminase [Haematospirillum jordaniae]